jgi:iron-sulfur cluster assembly protein
MITLSELAAEKIKDLLEEQGQPDSSLRVMVMPGANGGVQYMLALEEAAKSEDLIIEESGVKILVDEESVPFLQGTEIDYVEGLMRSGFTIVNPNFASTGGCACGGGGGCACGGGGGGCGGGGDASGGDASGGGGCACGGGGGGCGGH